MSCHDIHLHKNYSTVGLKKKGITKLTKIEDSIVLKSITGTTQTLLPKYLENTHYYFVI